MTDVAEHPSRATIAATIEGALAELDDLRATHEAAQRKVQEVRSAAEQQIAVAQGEADVEAARYGDKIKELLATLTPQALADLGHVAPKRNGRK